MSDKKASLHVDGIDEAIELPIYSGSIGPDVIDVGGLTAKGMFTYDPGFVSTAACESQCGARDWRCGCARAGPVAAPTG